ncbi:MAG: hypothetical protein KatS3mg035_0391 [Bacteroidia bacterium]|nr:MAG: hypothetical protein KatS3mg035_0391 [Bacteroidia bacterium]
METAELLKKVRKIEIKTRGLSSQVFSGSYHSAFKGKGMTFSEVREYQPGDDVRSIEWNVTARYNHPFVKVFEEERELTVMLLVDMSASRAFGTRTQLKQDLITELCAVLSFSAIQNNDKIGVIFFTDKIEKFIPPKKGKSHILRIIRELIEFHPEHKGTNIAAALKYLTNIIKQRCIAFVISDFEDENFDDALKIANKKHDIVALKIYDEREHILPDVGMVRLIDSETGEVRWVNTSDERVRKQYALNAKLHDEKLNTLFMKSGVDFTEIATHQPYIKPLVNLFKKRERSLN